MKKAKAYLSFDNSHPNKDGFIPVVVRVYSPAHKRNRDYATGELRHPDDLEDGRFSGASTGAVNKAQGVIDRLHVNEMSFDWDMFEGQFLDRVSGASINKFIEDRVSGIEGSGGSPRTYKDLLKRIAEFKGKNVPISSINKSFISKFKEHLSVTNSKNSVNMYLRTFKSIWRDARDDHGLVPSFIKDPFSGLDLQSEPTFKRYLTREELGKIFAFDGVINRSLYKDSLMMFKFSYLCRGMNPGDMFKLKWTDISGGTITYKRSKTGGAFKLTLKTETQEILDYYKGKNGPFVFPVYKDLDLGTISTHEIVKIKNNWSRTIGKNIRRIADRVGVDSHDIDAYTARHTFASHYLLYDKNPSIFRLMAYLGHSSERATRFYISSLKLDVDLDRI